MKAASPISIIKNKNQCFQLFHHRTQKSELFRLTFTSNSLNLVVSSTTLLTLLFEVSYPLLLVVNCVPLSCHFFFLNDFKCDTKNGFLHVLLTPSQYHYFISLLVTLFSYLFFETCPTHSSYTFFFNKQSKI